MKITCEREKLLSVFQIAATVAPSRSPKPILQNVKLEVTGQDALLMATDMEMGVRVLAPGVEIQTAGTAVLPVTRFGAILRESCDDKLHIETDAQGVIVTGKHSEFKLPGENPDEFPQVAAFDEATYHEVPARVFKELIHRTLFATDTESSRYALGGILLEFSPDKITAVSTDGRRLAKMEAPAQSIGGHQSGDTTTIAPSRSMQLIERALSDADGDVQIAARTNDLLVRSPRAVIYTRLVEGRFPKWRDVFPKRQEAVRIEIVVGPMYAAIRQAAVVASEQSRGVDFTFGEGSLVLAGLTAEVGSSRVEFPIPYEGQRITLTLDHRFVADFLRVLDPEKTFTLEIENAESAALFTTDDGYGYVVMPFARDR